MFYLNYVLFVWNVFFYVIPLFVAIFHYDNTESLFDSTSRNNQIHLHRGMFVTKKTAHNSNGPLIIIAYRFFYLSFTKAFLLMLFLSLLLESNVRSNWFTEPVHCVLLYHLSFDWRPQEKNVQYKCISVVTWRIEFIRN